MRNFQRLGPNHLAYTGLDVPELTEDDFSRNHAVGHPLAFGFERLQNDVEPFSQVRQNVIMIVRVPMACI